MRNSSGVIVSCKSFKISECGIILSVFSYILIANTGSVTQKVFMWCFLWALSFCSGSIWNLWVGFRDSVNPLKLCAKLCMCIFWGERSECWHLHILICLSKIHIKSHFLDFFFFESKITAKMWLTLVFRISFSISAFFHYRWDFLILLRTMKLD